MKTDVFIDVTLLHPQMKHPAIFSAFDNISEGNALVIHNDHDPKPLYHKLIGERGNCFSWTYLHNGPDTWEVEIRKNQRDTATVGEIASKDMHKAALLKKLGIDFCCGGKKTLDEACADLGLDVVRVQSELDEAPEIGTGAQLDFNSFSLSFLVDYIVNVHHGYVNANMPIIEDLAKKVAEHHGNNIPDFVSIYEKVKELRSDLTTHMKKEEQILFPTIKLMESGKDYKSSFETIGVPIYLMERDHDIAGELMKQIRVLSQNYTVPAEACNSTLLLWHKLEAFESDLFQHIHLENNILFPAAMRLEKK